MFEDSVWNMVRGTIVVGILVGGTAIFAVALWGGQYFGVGSTNGNSIHLPWMSAPELSPPQPVEQAPIHERKRAARRMPPPPPAGLATDATPEPVKPGRPSGPVRIVLSNIDGARLRIDGKTLDSDALPVEGIELSSGTHRFTIVLPNGSEFEIQRDVVLEPFGTTEIHLNAN